MPAEVELGVRPLNARSLVLSVLLGLPRAALTPRALVGLAQAFGVAPGTMRTALSRMVDAGELTLHRLEIARLDNDPNFPENGVLRLVMEGGK